MMVLIAGFHPIAIALTASHVYAGYLAGSICSVHGNSATWMLMTVPLSILLGLQEHMIGVLPEAFAPFIPLFDLLNFAVVIMAYRQFYVVIAQNDPSKKMIPVIHLVVLLVGLGILKAFDAPGSPADDYETRLGQQNTDPYNIGHSVTTTVIFWSLFHCRAIMLQSENQTSAQHKKKA